MGYGTRVCHAIDQRSTTKEMDQLDEVLIHFEDDETTNNYKVIDEGNLAGFNNDEPTVA
jgi:hypothetical protein